MSFLAKAISVLGATIWKDGDKSLWLIFRCFL